MEANSSHLQAAVVSQRQHVQGVAAAGRGDEADGGRGHQVAAVLRQQRAARGRLLQQVQRQHHGRRGHRQDCGRRGDDRPVQRHLSPALHNCQGSAITGRLKGHVHAGSALQSCRCSHEFKQHASVSQVGPSPRHAQQRGPERTSPRLPVCTPCPALPRTAARQALR